MSDQKLYRTSVVLEVTVEHWQTVTGDDAVRIIQNLLHIPAIIKVQQISGPGTVEVESKE